jgi:hypothetical protein
MTDEAADDTRGVRPLRERVREQRGRGVARSAGSMVHRYFSAYARGTDTVLGVPDDLEIVFTASNEMEAAMVCGRLSEAGIRSMQQLANTGAFNRFGGGGARDVYVKTEDAERARAALEEGAAS